MTSRIDAGELSQHAQEILSKVRDSRERYVIEQSGTPIAAVVSVDDLARLEESAPPPKRSIAEQLATLEHAAALRERMRGERGGRPLPDSAKTIRYLREMRGKKFLMGKKRVKANLRRRKSRSQTRS
ncbi:MAG: type II toxin-antitoxin system prevent-host-death family antitoxin [Chloroflexi bacterium]|nr:type II toxin-antitoxin system prevent-host-death family antitoxin [Chloroflexota bacterium]